MSNLSEIMRENDSRAKEGKERTVRQTANATTSEAIRDYKCWEALGGDLVLANCTFETGVSILEDVKLVVHVVVIVMVVIAFDNCTGKNSSKEEK
jgi:hypothetical protein